MLTELRIKNFAIIESLSLPLAAGLNVLSGETGAGKSIIVGALGLLLGERATAEIVRGGADRATVEGVFETEAQPEIAAILDARGIDIDEGQVVLRREVTAAGRTRAWVNDTTVTASALADVGRLLVNIHGQHEAQTLLEPAVQRRILDAFGGGAELAERVERAFTTLSDVRRQRSELEARRADAERRADYLRHVVREIDDAKLTSGDDVRLEEEARRLEHADELRTLAETAADALEGSGEADGVLSRLAVVQRALVGLQRIDASVGRLQELYDAAYYALEELAREADAYARGVELDPERLADVQRRRDVIFRLLKKHGPTLDDVLETGRRARAELDLVDSAAFDLRHLEARERSAQEQLVEAAAQLTAARAGGAARLSHAVDQLMPDLGLVDSHFAVALERCAEPGPHGAEDVEFQVALNVGYGARPLARVASGGELSRVMLALTTILARLDRVPTLVFDEVDAGIGGRIGTKVGGALRHVAAHHQVFAISHLPQIASAAHQHIVVSKGARGGVTTADVRVVDGEARVHEIARMLGGDPEREVSRAHARELLGTSTARPAPGAKAAGTGRSRETRRPAAGDRQDSP